MSICRAHVWSAAAAKLAGLAPRKQYRAAWRHFFRDWDVMLAPIVMVPAPPHSTLPPDVRAAEFDGQTVSYRSQSAYSGLSIMSGVPATAFPIGMSRDGLPISIQTIGPYLEDYTPIRFAGLVGSEIGGYQRPPGYE